MRKRMGPNDWPRSGSTRPDSVQEAQCGECDSRRIIPEQGPRGTTGDYECANCGFVGHPSRFKKVKP